MWVITDHFTESNAEIDAPSGSGGGDHLAVPAQIRVLRRKKLPFKFSFLWKLTPSLLEKYYYCNSGLIFYRPAC